MKNLKKLVLSAIAIMAFVFSVNAQKNYLKDADVAFENHQYFNAIELYKQAYTKVKKADAKARILYRTAQSYQEINYVKTGQTYQMQRTSYGFEPDGIQCEGHRGSNEQICLQVLLWRQQR